MNAKEFDLTGNKFTVLAMGLAIIWFLALLLNILFTSFKGIDVYWFIAAIISFAVSWLLLARMISKRLCGFAHICLVALGLLILLFVNWQLFFQYILMMLFFLIMVGLFTEIFLDWQNGFGRMILISSAFYLLFMFLPISRLRMIYLKELFYYNFITFSPDAVLFWIPFLIVILLILEKILNMLNKLPDKLQPLLIYRICFFAGLIYIAYYLIRLAAFMAVVEGFSGFIGNFFNIIFLYSFCLTLCMGVLELAENKLKRPLSFTV